jgi:hypothetical protein
VKIVMVTDIFIVDKQIQQEVLYKEHSQSMLRGEGRRAKGEGRRAKGEESIDAADNRDF